MARTKDTLMKFTLALAIILMGSTMIGCSDVVEVDTKLVQTYADVLVIREHYGDSATVKVKVDSVLESRQYQSDEFKRDLRSMGETPDLMKAFYDSVTYELRRRRDTL